jgi:hypothetical protein
MVRYERYEMTFAEIARTIDAQLPGSAYRHQVEGSDRNALGPCGWTRVTFTPGQAGGPGNWSPTSAITQPAPARRCLDGARI